MFQKLYEKNPNAKWFLRAMDDTYVHLPQMLEYLAQFDENVPYLLACDRLLVLLIDISDLRNLRVPNTDLTSFFILKEDVDGY